MSESEQVPQLLDALESAYRVIVERHSPPREDIVRLQTVLDDMRWYAGRLGPECWEQLPPGAASTFAATVRQLAEEAQREAASPQMRPVEFSIDRGKQHVGYVAELSALFASHP